MGPKKGGPKVTTFVGEIRTPTCPPPQHDGREGLAYQWRCSSCLHPDIDTPATNQVWPTFAQGLAMVTLVANLYPVLVVATNPVAHYPATFSSNFTERFNKTSDGAPTPPLPGFFALDMSFVDPKTKIVGAQVIIRAAGTQDGVCANLLPNSECTQLAVAGQRYIFGGGKCCRCCSWAHGCGPTAPKWVENATYVGRKDIGGAPCDGFQIQGFESNHLYQLASDSRTLCELNNADVDQLTFERKTFSFAPPAPGHFALPPLPECSEYCGPVSDCRFG